MGTEIETKRERENWKKGSKNQQKTENREQKRKTRHKTEKSLIKNDREQEPTDKPEGEKKGYTLNATAAYTLNCVDRHSRVTCQSWHVYVSLRPGSQVEWCEKENL